ncbi:MAG TPA: hypothetical protein VNJ29_00805, partial [Candidatus Nitrosotenuis sp.]|nr:hypothetical protein [Candidatus Nitrosotenuis sp.]
FLVGCVVRVVHPGVVERRVIVGGYPLYDVWPSYSFYYENWPVYHHKAFHHHHHKFHHKHHEHKHYKHFHHKHPHKHYKKHH